MVTTTIKGLPGKWFLETKNGVQHLRRDGRAQVKTNFIIKPNPDNIHINDGNDTIIMANLQELANHLKKKEKIYKMLKTKN